MAACASSSTKNKKKVEKQIKNIKSEPESIDPSEYERTYGIDIRNLGETAHDSYNDSE